MELAHGVHKKADSILSTPFWHRLLPLSWTHFFEKLKYVNTTNRESYILKPSCCYTIRHIFELLICWEHLKTALGGFCFIWKLREIFSIHKIQSIKTDTSYTFCVEFYSILQFECPNVALFLTYYKCLNSKSIWMKC